MSETASKYEFIRDELTKMKDTVFIHVSLGDKDVPATADQIDSAATDLEEFRKKHDIIIPFLVTGHNVSVKPVKIKRVIKDGADGIAVLAEALGDE